MRSVALEDALDERTRDLIRSRRSGKTHRRGWLVRRALAAADVLGLMLAFGLAQFTIGGARAGAPDRVSSLYEMLVFVATIPLWIVLARLYGLYDRDEERADHSSVDDLFGVFNMMSVGTWGFFVLTRLAGIADPGLAKLTLFWASAIALLVAGRVAARAACRQTDSYVQNTLIVGAGTVGQRVAEKLIQHPEYGVNVVGFVDDQPRDRLDTLEHLTVVGTTAQLSELVQDLYIERVIVAFSLEPHTATLETIRALNRLDVRVDVVPRLFEVLGPHVSWHAAEGLPLIGLLPARLSRSSLSLKRAMDIALSSAGLVLLAPLFAVVAVAIELDSRGPAFFRQRRMGRGDHVFRIYKFRTMTADADAHKHEVAYLNKHLGRDLRMFKIQDDPRVTRLGLFLRRTSIDELPQLINVLRGEMSLVGPRPLILDEDQHVDGWARHRLDLKPGMTGLWQVLGRDHIPFEEMVGLDYRYVTTWSLSNDLKLLARTLPVVLHRSGT